MNPEAMTRPVDQDLDIPCVSRDHWEAAQARQRYLAVCAIRADLLVTSRHCEGTNCGGHPICRPCYDLARREGLVR